MEKIVTQYVVEVIKTDVIGEITKYKSLDGKIYNTERECLFADEQHLSSITINTIKKMQIGSIESIECYFVTSEEEMNAVKAQYSIDANWECRHTDVSFAGKQKPSIGEWVGFCFVDGGDSWDSLYIYSQTSLREMITDFINATKCIMED